jgi:hypothetical protein
MRKFLKIAIVLIALLITAGVAFWFFFRAQETGPVSVEVTSEDGFLKLVMALEKTRFTKDPKEPVRINLTLINVGDQEITLTFRYKSKFDFKVFDVDQGEDTYRWSYIHVEGPLGWSVDPSSWQGEPLTLESSEISVVTLKPGESMSEIMFWDQYSVGEATQAFPPNKPFPCAKGHYRIWGYAGLSSWSGYEHPDNPLRYFEYVSPTTNELKRVVLETPPIDIWLV